MTLHVDLIVIVFCTFKEISNESGMSPRRSFQSKGRGSLDLDRGVSSDVCHGDRQSSPGEGFPRRGP